MIVLFLNLSNSCLGIFDLKNSLIAWFIVRIHSSNIFLSFLQLNWMIKLDASMLGSLKD